MQIFLLNIMFEQSQSLLFTCSSIFIQTWFLFWPPLKHKCCLRRDAVIFFVSMPTLGPHNSAKNQSNSKIKVPTDPSSHVLSAKKISDDLEILKFLTSDPWPTPKMVDLHRGGVLPDGRYGRNFGWEVFWTKLANWHKKTDQNVIFLDFPL